MTRVTALIVGGAAAWSIFTYECYHALEHLLRAAT